MVHYCKNTVWHKRNLKKTTRILEGYWACHVTKDSESGTVIGRPAASNWCWYYVNCQVTSSVSCKDSNTNFRKVNCLLNYFFAISSKKEPNKMSNVYNPPKMWSLRKKIPCFSFLQGIGKTNVVSCITKSFLQGSSLNICCTYKFM